MNTENNDNTKKNKYGSELSLVFIKNLKSPVRNTCCKENIIPAKKQPEHGIFNFRPKKFLVLGDIKFL